RGFKPNLREPVDALVRIQTVEEFEAETCGIVPTLRPLEVAALDNLEFDDEIVLDTESDDTIQRILHSRDIGVIYGASGVGKSFVATGLSYHVPHGMAWYGMRVRQSPVLYVALEGVRGVRNRMLACRSRYGSAGRMLARSKVHTKLDKSELG